MLAAFVYRAPAGVRGGSSIRSSGLWRIGTGTEGTGARGSVAVMTGSLAASAILRARSIAEGAADKARARTAHGCTY